MSRHEYDRSVIGLYSAELTAIEDILTELGVPTDDDKGDNIPTRIRVRVLADEVLNLRAAKAEGRDPQ